jgi:hypothetical protein
MSFLVPGLITGRKDAALFLQCNAVIPQEREWIKYCYTDCTSKLTLCLTLEHRLNSRKYTPYKLIYILMMLLKQTHSCFTINNFNA